jgi:hypothetical protein
MKTARCLAFGQFLSWHLDNSWHLGNLPKSRGPGHRAHHRDKPLIAQGVPYPEHGPLGNATVKLKFGGDSRTEQF